MVLIHKGANRPVEGANNFRPNCLINNIVKLMERLVLARLNRAVEDDGGIMKDQFGFRKESETVNAITSMVNTVKISTSGADREGQMCLLVTLDVKNAFNTATWRAIDAALRKRRISNYFIDLVRSYLKDRAILVHGNEGVERMRVHADVPQNSVLGPALWNVFYNGVLELGLPRRARMLGYADYLAMVMRGRTIGEMEAKAGAGPERINEWMAENGLRLAPQKSEEMLLGRRISGPPINVYLEGQLVATRAEGIKYLGVLIDPRRTFRRHLTDAVVRATKAAIAMGRLMPNMGGPSTAKRVLLQSMVSSRLMYVAPVWAEQAGRYKCNREALTRAQ